MLGLIVVSSTRSRVSHDGTEASSWIRRIRGASCQQPAPGCGGELASLSAFLSELCQIPATPVKPGHLTVDGGSLGVERVPPLFLPCLQP